MSVMATEHPVETLSVQQTAADLIAAERRRQAEQEGYSSAHDDEHGWQLLWQASMAYVNSDYSWPWSAVTFKPSNLIRNYVKAAALAQAACEVADRMSVPSYLSACATGQLFQCEQFLDGVLAGISDLGLGAPRAARERDVYDEIAAERQRASAKHRETSMEAQPATAMLRLAILTEEVGEVAREFNDARHHDREPDRSKLRSELIQVAAMASAWADRLGRS